MKVNDFNPIDLDNKLLTMYLNRTESSGSFLLSMFWLVSEVYHTSSIEISIFLFCSGGWFSFTLVGISIIAEIVDSLTKKFEDIKKKQKAVKKSRPKEE